MRKKKIVGVSAFKKQAHSYWLFLAGASMPSDATTVVGLEMSYGSTVEHTEETT